MPTIKISKTTVEDLPLTDKGQIEYHDSVLSGFAVRVGTSKKVFIVRKRVHGKPVRVALGVHGQVTAEAARKMAQEALGQMSKGENPTDAKRHARAKGVTLDQAYQDYIVARSLKPRTLRDCEYIMKTYFPDWRGKAVKDITRDMITGRHREIGEDKGGQAQSNLAMRVLRGIINFAISKYRSSSGKRLIDENPVTALSEMKSWYRVDRRQTVIKGHELPALFNALDKLAELSGYGAMVKDYVLFLLFTGMRRTEAAKLTWNAVDFKDKTILVTDTKNRRPLSLPLPDFLFDLLSRRYEVRTNDFLFPSDSRSGYLGDPKRMLAKIRTESGVAFTLHDTRRSFCSIAESLDISHFALKRIVNHSLAGSDVTSGYIVHDVERLRAPMQLICDRILQLAGHKGQADVLPFTRRKAAP